MHLTAGHRQVDTAEGTYTGIVLDQPANLQQWARCVAHLLLRYPLGLSTRLAACAHRSWDRSYLGPVCPAANSSSQLGHTDHLSSTPTPALAVVPRVSPPQRDGITVSA